MPEKTPKQYRESLVESIRAAVVLTNPAVEASVLEVPRHLFLPDVPLASAYHDETIPIKYDGLGMVISSATQPRMMCIMLEQLEPRPGDNVLEIGTATGYNAAVLRYLTHPNGFVTTLELDGDLVRQAKNNLHRTGASDVRVVQSDGAQGYAPRAAYDRIISTVGVWDVPVAWTQQLKVHGRLVVPIWLDGVQVSAAFVPQSDGTFYSDQNFPCAFIYIRGEAAGPNLQKQVGSTSLVVLADEVNKIDTAALHSLLSDDHELCYLGYPLEEKDFWYGFQLYLMMNEPPGYIFAVYAVLGDKQVYGLDGKGVALFSPGSASFVPYHQQGNTHCYGGSDAFVSVQEIADRWDQAGRPGVDQIRLRLIPKSFGEPAITYGKLFSRRDHYLHMWMEEKS